MTGTDDPIGQRREQLLKLVSKTFYRELIEYGVAKDEVLTVANHLLDNLLDRSPAQPANRQLPIENTIDSVTDRWTDQQTLMVDQVALRPLDAANMEEIAGWLHSPEVRESFVPALPADPAEVDDYFSAPAREFLGIYDGDRLVGTIGAENIDTTHSRLEMKKLVGVTELRGRGIGTRATFAFLYHSFMVRGIHKVYVHSLDTNVRNLNVNSRLGFEVEGIFLEEFKVGGRYVNIVRMALLDPIWRALFAAVP